MDQQTDEWFAARLGKVTASRIADLMATTKSGASASRANYAAQLVTERLTGRKQDSFSSAAMAWGTETEPQARATYELETGNTVKEVGFLDHPVLTMTGASPDGLVSDDGMLEIKCPNSATHIETLKSEKVADKYVKQMQWQMACAGRAWCDFVSFDPRLPDEMQTYIRRVPRDDAMIDDITAAVQVFLAEVDDTVKTLRAKYGKGE